jgi:hypothetical protein
MLKRFAPRFGFESAREVADNYPKIPKHKTALDNIVRDIGLETVRFEHVRNKEADLLIKYGVPPRVAATGKNGKTSKGGASGTNTKATSNRKSGTAAFSLDDPKGVYKQLRSFSPKGKNREKVVTLLREMRDLRLDNHPHAFCFLLRSMFEISAKAYCTDHAGTGGPKCTKPNGDDRPLADVLRDITKYLTNNNQDKQMVKLLHGAMTELGKPSSMLSVTSMNQLVHNPRFSVKQADICVLFHRIFPLLETMNT